MNDYAEMVEYVESSVRDAMTKRLDGNAHQFSFGPEGKLYINGAEFTVLDVDNAEGIAHCAVKMPLPVFKITLTLKTDRRRAKRYARRLERAQRRAAAGIARPAEVEAAMVQRLMRPITRTVRP